MKKSIILTSALITSLISINGASAADQTAARESSLKQQILNANSFITDSSIRDEKFQAMEQSPFAFFRATNYVYYSDLGNGVIPIPAEWKSTQNISTWIEGDAHTDNVGFFDNDKGEVKFDLNDFDESYIAPFYWDLIRFSTSIFLLCDETPNVSLSDQERSDLVSSFLQTYQDTLKEVNGNSSETSVQLDEGYLSSGFVQDQLRDAKSSDDKAKLLDKWTVTGSSGRTFDFSNSDLAPVSSGDYSAISANWNGYKSTIDSFVQSKPSSYFTIKDIARRLHSGLGSLGVDKYYVLIEGDSSSADDDEILEIKEQRLPSMFMEGSLSQSTYDSEFTNHAQRSSIAYLAEETEVDNHLGYMTFNNKSFRVRRISPWKEGIKAKDFNSKSDLEDFVKYSAKALAYAHARADKDYSTNFVDYNFEQGALDAIDVWPQFKTKVLAYSSDYYQQVKADYSLYEDLMNNGEIK
ncbi:DUF2252 family protein [Falsibacillus albus]|uniref:DUF2252 family protein n=1 Tax=Falsibacillus albus TaxID=2478915 RepID=UPI001314609E|nr:DUF2252 family protein [Falsibacillus albus]